MPIWEHTKRLARFDIRPLIKIDNEYFWSPYSIERSSQIWMVISGIHRLPSNIDAPNVAKVLEKGHRNLEISPVNKIKEIVLRHTPHVQTNIRPSDYDSSSIDIGDYDVFAYLKDKNILLNIESKIIDPPRSNKDSARMQRRTFISHTNKKGQYEKCYLEKVTDRASYLKTKGKDFALKLNWPISDEFRVVSICYKNWFLVD